MKDLSPRQRDTLAYIHESLTKRGYAPTHRELAERFGVSGKGAATSDCVKALERKGMLERSGRHTRGLRITDAGYAVLAEPTPEEMREAVRSAERSRGLLIRAWSLLTQIAPQAPLLGEIRDELSLGEQVVPAGASTNGATS